MSSQSRHLCRHSYFLISSLALLSFSCLLFLLSHVMHRIMDTKSTGIEKMVWIVSCRGYNFKYNGSIPLPLSLSSVLTRFLCVGEVGFAKSLLNVLQNHYPERWTALALSVSLFLSVSLSLSLELFSLDIFSLLSLLSLLSPLFDLPLFLLLLILFSRLGMLIVVDPPFVFRAFWKMVYPFIDANTKKKILFVSGNDTEKRKLIGEFIELSQLSKSLFAGDATYEFNGKEYVEGLKKEEAKLPPPK
jgi:hypothetical protein